jgi:hypothetical protein
MIFILSCLSYMELYVILVDTMMFRNSKNFMEDNTIEGLDELARVTVLNDNEPQYDVRLTLF